MHFKTPGEQPKQHNATYNAQKAMANLNLEEENDNGSHQQQQYRANNNQSRNSNRNSTNSASNNKLEDTINNNNNNSTSSNNNNSSMTTGRKTPSSSATPAILSEEEARAKKVALELRKQDLERRLSEKNWLLQQLQKHETQIVNGGGGVGVPSEVAALSVNELLAGLEQQYRQEQAMRSRSSSFAGGSTSSTGGGGGADELTSILRRKTLTGVPTLPSSLGLGSATGKENQPLNGGLHALSNNNNSDMSGGGSGNNNNDNIINPRLAEVANRSSEYDNYPVMAGGGMGAAASLEVDVNCLMMSGSGGGGRVRATPTPTAHLNYIQLQQQQAQRPQAQYAHMHGQSPQYQLYLPLVQQQQQQHASPQHVPLQYAHYHHQSPQQQQRQLQQLLVAQQQQQQALHLPHTPTADTISLYSMNSPNVATLRQQRVPPQQQPIVVQCDKYYLSPTTHPSYGDGGGFIKSSQNIKRYGSPMASPTQLPTSSSAAAATLSQLSSPHHHLHTAPGHLYAHLRPSDAISLAPSYVSLAEAVADLGNGGAGGINQPLAGNSAGIRWRSQSNLPPPGTPTMAAGSGVSIHLSPTGSGGLPEPNPKSLSSDMLAEYPSIVGSPTIGGGVGSNNGGSSSALNFYGQGRKLEELHCSSSLGDRLAHKKGKSKQWLESSLDGPPIRSPLPGDEENNNTFDVLMMSISSTTTAATTTAGSNRAPARLQMHTTTTTHTTTAAAHSRERGKLSSQSMSSGRHYSLSAHRNAAIGAQRLLQDDEGRRYAKLSQSTSQLNAIEAALNGGGVGGAGPAVGRGAGGAAGGGVPAAVCSISPAYALDTEPLDIPAFKFLPPKPQSILMGGMQPPPRPPPPPGGVLNSGGGDAKAPHLPAPLILNVTPTALGGVTGALSPEIRIESPKNMTVVQQATFQPYKEVTKPFEMSDFYKYSTKYRQKDSVVDAPAN